MRVVDFLALHPVSGGYTVVGKSGLVALADGLETFSANAPVQAGDVIGLWEPSGLNNCILPGSSSVDLGSVGTDPNLNDMLPTSFPGVGGLALNESANLVTGYSAQLTSKTQAMDGDLKLPQGSTLSVGYDFTIPGQHPAANIGFTGPTFTFNVTCTAGTPSFSPVVVTFSDPNSPYQDPLNSTAWYPSGDQKSSSTYQGSATLPTCTDPNGLVRLQQGGTFSATVTSDVQVPKVNIRWHYKGATGAGGGWSGASSVTPGSAAQPDRP